MNIQDIIAILIIAFLFVAALSCIYISRKRGRSCIGCPGGGSCRKCNKNSRGGIVL